MGQQFASSAHAVVDVAQFMFDLCMQVQRHLQSALIWSRGRTRLILAGLARASANVGRGRGPLHLPPFSRTAAPTPSESLSEAQAKQPRPAAYPSQGPFFMADKTTKRFPGDEEPLEAVM